MFAFVIIMVVTTCSTHDASQAARRHPRKKTGPKPSAVVKRTATEHALAKLQQEIAKYESELREHEKREKHSKETIHAFEKRTASLKTTIARLEREQSQLEGQKSEVDLSLNETSNTLDALKEAYAKSSRQLYMQGALAPLDAEHFIVLHNASDPVRMSYYAQAIGRAHALDRSRLDSMKQSLGASSETLASNIAIEHEQIGTHEQEATALEAKKAAEAKELAQIQIRKARLKKLLAERRASEKRLENIIAGLVNREAAARRATTKRNRARPHEEENEVSLGPAHGPHSLDWPSATHRILQGFGEHRNAELGTVTMNLGIDIAAPEGSAVRAAAEGEVALVSSLPSYGTVIVIRHSGGIHTVYADLAGASVPQGTHIHAGQTIGKSGTSEMSGPHDRSSGVIHFEVWKGKSKQNPVGWLK